MNWTDYFEEKIKTVPQELQEAILSIDFLTGLRTVQKKYLLHIDQGSELEGATFKFMFGDIRDPDSYRSEIVEKLRIPTSLATNILTDIEKEILAPIRQKLQKIEEEKYEEEAEDAIIFGKTSTGETLEELTGEESPTENKQESQTETLQTGTSLDHSTLSHEDILNEIENPLPAIKREVVIESNIAKPQSSSQTSFTDIANNFSQKPEVPASALDADFNKTVAQSLGISRPKESVAKTASVLQSASAPATPAQKLSETTASKPREINIPADPYREAF